MSCAGRESCLRLVRLEATSSPVPDLASPRSWPQLPRLAVSEDLRPTLPASHLALFFHSSVLRSSRLSPGIFATMTSADSCSALALQVSPGQCWFCLFVPLSSTVSVFDELGVCVYSHACPPKPASLLIRVPAVEPLLPVLSSRPSRFRNYPSATVGLIASVGLLSSR